MCAARVGADVHAFALGPEQDEQFGRSWAGAAEPVRGAGVELGGLGGLQDEVELGEPQPDAAGQHVHPFIALVGAQVGVGLGGREEHLVGTQPARPLGQRDEGAAVAAHGPCPDAAGLAGAVALARSRRSVLVVDAGEPHNAPAAHVHNFLTRDGTPPSQIYEVGRAELTSYGGYVETGRVTALSRDGDRFAVQIAGRAVTARRVLAATGLRDELPDVPGLAERWGIDVLHCPYCHGWEVRDQRIGILATGPAAAHQALLFRQLSPHVTVLAHTPLELTPEQQEQTAAPPRGQSAPGWTAPSTRST